MEALSRLNILSTTISGGPIGHQVLNDIEARRSWLAAFRETAVFFNEHSPFEITFDPGLIQDGQIDYQRETINLAMRIALDPSETGWAALNTLLNGLERTGRRQTWGFNGWPFLDITPRDPSAVVFTGKQRLSFKIEVALLNETGRTIGTNSVTLNIGAFQFAAGDKAVSPPERVLDLVRFPKVDARYLTPVLTVAITAVNGIPARTLNTAGYMRISAGDLTDRMRRQELANAAEGRQQEAAETAEKRRQEAEAELRNARSSERWKKIVDNWHPIPPLYFELGYVWEPDYPIGFRIGTFGFYTTWNFHLPDWQGYTPGPETYHPYYYDENRNIYELDPAYYVYKDIGSREQQSFEWVAGFSINIIDNFLMIPLGIGGRHSLEFGLFEYRYISVAGSKPVTEWIPAGKPKLYKEANWNSDFLFEIGLEINPIKWISLLATYRLIGFEKSSFTLGSCFTVMGRKR
jgi:opacity protein-like surface antigen